MKLPPEIKEIIIDQLKCEVDVSNAWLAFFNTLEGLSSYHQRRHTKEMKKRTYEKHIQYFMPFERENDGTMTFRDVEYKREDINWPEIDFEDIPLNESILILRGCLQVSFVEMGDTQAFLLQLTNLVTADELTVMEKENCKEKVAALYELLVRARDILL